MGLKVIVLDDLSTGKMENLPGHHPNLTFIRGEITDSGLLLNIQKTFPDMDYIFHLAAIASVTKSMEHLLPTHHVNFVGTLQLLQTFKDLDVKKFVYASSAAIYGNTEEIPVKENRLPAPMSPYGADKLQGEYYLKIFNDAFNVPAVACRFFNVFGERQDPSSPYSGVISIFFDRALLKKNGGNAEIDVYGDGNQTRDFIYVKDIVRAMIFFAITEGIRDGVFNLGYGKKITISDLAHQVQGLMGVEMKVNYKPEREGDIRHSQADIQELLNTGFQFQYDFDEGLKRLAKYFTG